MKKVFLVLPLFSILYTGCKSDKKEQPVDASVLYFDYEINAEEGNDNLTILLQFRAGGPEGEAVSIQELGTVTIDGEQLEVDSTPRTGTFYELHKPIAGFSGKHSLVFTPRDELPISDTFNFIPLTILSVIPDTIRRDGLLIMLDGLDDPAAIRVLLTDTSAISDGINEVDTLENNQLLISREYLERLSPGPVQLELIRESERTLDGKPGRGGKLVITYGLRRQFFLAD